MNGNGICHRNSIFRLDKSAKVLRTLSTLPAKTRMRKMLRKQNQQKQKRTLRLRQKQKLRGRNNDSTQQSICAFYWQIRSGLYIASGLLVASCRAYAALWVNCLFNGNNFRISPSAS